MQHWQRSGGAAAVGRGSEVAGYGDEYRKFSSRAAGNGDRGRAIWNLDRRGAHAGAGLGGGWRPEKARGLRDADWRKPASRCRRSEIGGVRFGIWIDAERMREQDLAVAGDLKKLGACVMLIGENLPQGAADLLFQLPAVPRNWQFLIDIIPAQLAAEKLARLGGADSDTFRYCSFIVEDEFGLLPEEHESAGENK